MPVFSVIVTTHDRANLLRRAIRSIKAQHGVSVQTIVVSDRTCQATYAVVASELSGSDVFAQRSGEPGPAASRNLGMTLATGDNIVFLDDDDALSPTYLSDAGRHVDGRSVIFTDFIVVLERLDVDGAPVALGGEQRSLSAHRIDDLYAKNFIPPACLVYPRSAVAGREFDPTLVLNEDWDFILNVKAGMPLRHVPIDGPVVYTREAPDNRGRRNDHLLVPTYLQIYANRPAPTHEHRLARQAFFASAGLNAPLHAF